MLIDRHWDVILIHYGNTVTQQAPANSGFIPLDMSPETFSPRAFCEQKEA